MSYDDALKLSELRKATRKCVRGVRYKDSAAEFYLNAMTRSKRLKDDIVNGRYRISKYTEFVITSPKRREVSATKFRDRVWQKSMCDNGVRSAMTKDFIYDNCACQENKGTDFAIDRIICFLQRFFRRHGRNGFYLHLDVKGYFPNTPHTVSKAAISKRLGNEPGFERHLHAIIDSFVDKRPPEVIAGDPYHERGTFLGSEISQITQLAVPSHIDHAVKEKFRIKEYIRYNDDMLFIHEDPEILISVREYVTQEFAKLGLTVVDKSGIQPLKNRIRFMKKTFILKAGGRVIVLIDSKKISEERRRLRKLKAKVDSGQKTMEKVRDHYQSFIASVSRCDSEAAVRHLDRFYESVFGEKPVYKRGKDNAYSKCKRANQKKRRNGSQRGGKSYHAGRLPAVHVHDDRH